MLTGGSFVLFLFCFVCVYCSKAIQATCAFILVATFLPSVTQSVTSAGWERKTCPGSYLCITNIESVTNKYITLHVCACISWCINLAPIQVGHKYIHWWMTICNIKSKEWCMHPLFAEKHSQRAFLMGKTFLQPMMAIQICLFWPISDNNSKKEKERILREEHWRLLHETSCFGFRVKRHYNPGCLNLAWSSQVLNCFLSFHRWIHNGKTVCCSISLDTLYV